MKTSCKVPRNRILRGGCRAAGNPVAFPSLDSGRLPEVVHKKRPCASRSGTSLVEVMVGMLILAILAVTAMMTLQHPRFLVSSSAHKQMAIHAASEVLEEVLSAGYSSLATGTVSLDNLGDRYTMNGRGLTGSRTVADWDGGAPPILLVTVAVDYPGGDSPVELETLITP